MTALRSRPGPLHVALLVLLAGWACDPGPARVLLVGDSITAGNVSEPKGPPYPELLAASLGKEIAIEVAACSGSTAWDWRPSADPMSCAGEWTAPNPYVALAIPGLPADAAVVLLGTNDSAGAWAAQRTADDYEAALREIVTGLLADGADRVVLMTPPPVYHRLKRYVRLQDLRLRVQAICDDVSGVICGPDLYRLLVREDFEPGNVHPNAAGHAKIARALGETLGAPTSR